MREIEGAGRCFLKKFSRAVTEQLVSASVELVIPKENGVVGYFGI